MTISTSIHSNAFNFMSYLGGGVDARTGVYSLSIDFPPVSGNDQLGPELGLVLRYSPLNTADSGYGKGWSLQLSQFDPLTRIVSLVSGETHKQTSRDGTRLKMQEQKLDSFHLYEESNSRWRLAHRSGQVEILELQGAGQHRVAMPVQIFNEQGQWLKLTYTSFNDYPLLVAVTDMRGDTLVTITRESNRARLSVRSDAGEAAYNLVFEGTDKEVGRIELPTENLASWRFKYGLERGLEVIKEVRTPTGGYEQVFYEDGGHLFPNGSGRTPLPRVTRHVAHPGFGQPSIDTRYTYSSNGHNFLGGNAQLNWIDDGLDNLFRQVIEYDYGVTETLWVDNLPVRSTARTYNKFHLLTQEVTCHGEQLSGDRKEVVGNHIHQVTTRYNLTAGKTFAEQPNYCQLEHGVDTQWWLADNPTAKRTESTSSTYYNNGNLQSQTAINGITETFTWYENAGEGYPGDAEGFVRHLKEKVQKPAEGHPGNAVARTTRYTYQSLPVLAASAGDVQLDHWVAPDKETLDSNGPLKVTEYTFESQPAESPLPDKPLLHGRALAEQVRFPNPKAGEPGEPETLDTRTDFTYSYQELDWGVVKRRSAWANGKVRVIETLQSVTGFDKTAKRVRLQHSLATGEPLLNRDDNDVEIRYEYDALRRVTREIVSPGKPEEAQRRYEYQLCANETEQASQTRIDVKDVQTVAQVDGLYRVIAEQRQDVDDPARAGELRDSYAATFDAWGRQVSETEIDWLAASELHLTRQIRYDVWGEQWCEIGADGVGQFAETDPIGDGTTGPIKREWRQLMFDDAGQELENGAKTAVTETQLDLFENAVRVRRLAKEKPEDALETKVMSLVETAYDGFGRKQREVSGLSASSRQIETFSYDAFDRLLTHGLRDRTEVVKRSYAAHSDRDLPVKIAVDGIELGEQAFDGLDRMVVSITGGRRQVYSYEPGQLKPSTVTTPTGDITYQYLPYLTEEPVQRSLGGQQASYTFDQHNARLTACTEAGGEAFTRSYYSTGEVRTETRGEYEMAYGYSYRGRLESYKDVLDQTQVYEYDQVGRLQSTSLGSLQTDFSYDDLGRTRSYETVDKTGDVVRSLKTTLGYDVLERETSRTFSFSDHPEQTLVQEYDDFDRLTKRTLKEGSTLLSEETYRYDTRGRLDLYNCTGDQCPMNPYGTQINQELFLFDALDNITVVATTLMGGKTNVAQYSFSPTDPVQLIKITNTHEDYQKQIDLEYDANGNLVLDDAQRKLEYDALNRLRRVEDPQKGACTYGYDPMNVLSSTSAL
jgi:hypothetical protein